jgi:hypothetical protein
VRVDGGCMHDGIFVYSGICGRGVDGDCTALHLGSARCICCYIPCCVYSNSLYQRVRDKVHKKIQIDSIPGSSTPNTLLAP